MIEPGWISFNTAAHEIRKRVGCGWAEAKAQLRSACADATIETKKAPLEEPPEFWSGVIPASEWREREVDQDGPDADACKIEIMLSEDDYRRWLNGEPKPRMPKPRTITLRKRDTAKEAIAALWPGGIPDGLVNKAIVKNVDHWLKANGASPLSQDTILRAAGRKE